jgi:hypothetical protein
MDYYLADLFVEREFSGKIIAAGYCKKFMAGRL